jgi:protease-4
MKLNNLVNAILRGKWLFDPEQANNYFPLVSKVLAGETPFGEKEETSIELVCFSKGEAYTIVLEDNWDLAWAERRDKIIPGTVVMIPVEGPILKHDAYCGPAGSMSKANLINKLSEHDNVASIVMDIDSPGGMVDGTQTLVQAIQNCEKPIHAVINDGMACSAAYWIASACDSISVTQKTDVVGSIGVYMTIADWETYYENEGLPIHSIYSTKSSEKNKPFKDAMKGDYKEVTKSLDFIATEFINSVKETRNINSKAGDPFKGATFFAEEALEIGLIDAIKPMSDLIKELEYEAQSSLAQSTDNSTQSNMKISDLIAEFEAAEPGQAREDARAALESAYENEEYFTPEEHQAAVDAAVNAENASRADEIAALESQVKDLTAENENLKSEITELKAPAEDTTDTVDEEADDQFGKGEEISTPFSDSIK